MSFYKSFIFIIFRINAYTYTYLGLTVTQTYFFQKYKSKNPLKKKRKEITTKYINQFLIDYKKKIYRKGGLDFRIIS